MAQQEIILGTINIASLVKAYETFARFKAFEFTFEQAWKTLKKVLVHKGLECGSPRDTFRVAAVDGLIINPTKWFVYLEKRNLTSHTYNQEIVDLIVACFDDFGRDVESILTALRAQK